MKLLIVFMLTQSAATAQIATLDDFLSNTLLGEKSETVEKAYRMRNGALNEGPGYYDISHLEYGKLKLKVNVFVRDRECKALGLYVDQLRIKDVNGHLIHRDEAEIDDIFHELLGDLTKRYGHAPLVVFGPDSSEFGMEASCQAYTWANDRYSLMLMLCDNVTTHTLTLRQYRIDEVKGEFTGEEQISYLQKLYATRSGELPANWPSKSMIDTPRIGQSSNDDLPKEPPNKKAPEALGPEAGTSVKEVESDNAGSFVWYSLSLMIALLIVAGFWIKTHR